MASNDATSAAAMTPGQLLATKRKAKGIDEKAAAQALKISTQRLRALEADDYSDFPAETYVRGHLRNYCRLLSMDENVLMDAYESFSDSEDWEPQQPKPANVYHEPSASNPLHRWWVAYVVLVLVVLVWVTAYWLLTRPDADSARQDPFTTNNDAPLPAQLENVPKANDESVTIESSSLVIKATGEIEVEALDSAAPVGEANAEPVVSQVAGEGKPSVDTSVDATEEFAIEPPTPQVNRMTAAEVVSAVTAQEPSVAEASEPVAPDTDSLRFTFENPCWLKVTDAAGETIYSGLQQPGTQLVLSGQGPFRIVVGNVDGTSLVYNGEAVQLTAQNGNTARLQVGG